MKQRFAIRAAFAAALLLLACSWGFAADKKEPAKPAVPAAKATEAKPAVPAAKATEAKVELVDINSATKEELIKVPGIGEAYAQKIISGRPYKMKSQLKSRKVVSDQVYDKITDRIIAKQPKK